MGHAASSGPIYVLAPSGQVLHTLRLSPPEDGSLSAVKVGKDRVVAEFIERFKNSRATSRVLLQVLDATTGEKYAEYQHSAVRIGVLASYQPDIFSFLAVHSEDGAVILVNARPQ